MSGEVFAVAVDLGASSGRVVLGRIDRDGLRAQVVHRFANEPVTTGPRLRWDIDALVDGTFTGLRTAFAQAPVRSVGIDTWAVDYGLLDADGGLIAPPTHYRDSRTAGVMERISARLGAESIYARTGLQFLPFNTSYQLLTEPTAVLRRARTMLMMPDLLVHRLTGALGAERTNASTSGLYDVTEGRWAEELIGVLGLPRRIFPELCEPGTMVGPLRPELRAVLGAEASLRVTTVGSHDTASAVAAVPAAGSSFAYISCGTWSLVGVELTRPVLSAASLAANFTNEVGIGGTIRYLRNVMGLWLLQECLRHWRLVGWSVDMAQLLAAAEHDRGPRAIVDAQSTEFVAPGDMPRRIQAACQAGGQPVPETPVSIVRCIVDSLAVAHARTVAEAARLSGQPIEEVHVVGGGARNALLCQRTADACGLPVLAGPAEATALGNLAVQAMALGLLRDRHEARALIRRTHPPRRFQPRGRPWSA